MLLIGPRALSSSLGAQDEVFSCLPQTPRSGVFSFSSGPRTQALMFSFLVIGAYLCSSGPGPHVLSSSSRFPSRSELLLEALGKNSFPCLSKILEPTYIPWLMAFSSITKASSVVSSSVSISDLCFCYHTAVFDSDSPAYFY